MRPPAPSPQELPGRGRSLSRRYRLHAPANPPAEPGGLRASDEVLARQMVVQFLPPGASLAAVEAAIAEGATTTPQQRPWCAARARAAAAAGHPPRPAVPPRRMITAAARCTGEKVIPWLRDNCA